MKIHLDTDLGGDIDDLCAFAMLLRWPGVEITGITVVGDDKGKRTGYVAEVLRLAHRAYIPVACGADVSGGFYHYFLGLPPEENYWPDPVKPITSSLDKALGLLKQAIDEDVTIIGIGPLTNLFLVDQRYPGCLAHANLFLMGGYIYPPRMGYPHWKNEDDFNFQIDVASSFHVLNHSNPTLVPLPVAGETYLRESDLLSIHDHDPLGQLIKRQAKQFLLDEQLNEKYGHTYSSLPSDIINFLYDPFACAVAMGWDAGVTIAEIPLKIYEENGWLVEKVDTSGKMFKVITSTDGAAFNNFWKSLTFQI